MRRRLHKTVVVSIVITLCTVMAGGQTPFEWKSGFQWPEGNGLDGPVGALTCHDDGSGPVLYAGGGFRTAGGVTVNGIAEWDGTTWIPLGNGTNGGASALTVFDDGTGPALYAGGGFTMAGDVSANNIAKWNGTTWAPLSSGLTGGGFNTFVDALTVFDDGMGPALYAGGRFTLAGDVAANNIAKWDGTAWTPLGSGVGCCVYALTVFDDGAGPALYGGGSFTLAGDVAANRIAKWNGTTWAPLGSGLTQGYSVDALSVFDNGTGPALYAGGNFFRAGEVTVTSSAKWNGVAWSGGPSISRDVFALTVFDDGNGPALYIGGGYRDLGGVVLKVGRESSQVLGTGFTSFPRGNPLVRALSGCGPAFYAGGMFNMTDRVPSSNFAQWAMR